MSEPQIVCMAQPEGAGEIDYPREDRREIGCTTRETWTLYESADGLMTAGIWSCEVGRWRIAFPAGKEEYFFVLEGHVRLHAPDGHWTDVRAGQAAVIPAGFQGAFEVLAPVRKHFVVVDRA